MLARKLSHYFYTLEIRDTPLQLIIACVIGLLLGVGSLFVSPSLLLGVWAVGILLTICVKRPEFALLAILIATSTIVYADSVPLISIGVGSLSIVDLTLLGLLGLIVLRTVVESDFKLIHTPLDKPLLLFYGLSILSTAVGLLRSEPTTDIKLAMKDVRLITYYLTFFTVTALVRSEQHRGVLLTGIKFLGTCVAITMIVQYALGTSVVLLPGRIETFSSSGTAYENVIRILPPGQSLILVGFMVQITTLALTKISTQSAIQFIQCGLMGLAVLITFNRNFWIVVLLGLLMLVVLMRQVWPKFVVWLLAFIFLGILALFLINVEGEARQKQLLSAALERLGTLTSTDVVNESSLEFRLVEDEYALRTLSTVPLLGLGLGAQYRPFTILDWEGYDGRAYIHNGHFWIMLKSGLIAYACFAWLSLLFLIRSFKYWRKITNAYVQAGVLGFALTYLGMLFACLVNPMFMDWAWVPVIGMMMGFAESTFGELSATHHATETDRE